MNGTGPPPSKELAANIASADRRLKLRQSKRGLQKTGNHLPHSIPFSLGNEQTPHQSTRKNWVTHWVTTLPKSAYL